MKSLLVLFLIFLLSTSAWADGGCGSAFHDWGCFKYSLFLFSPMAFVSWMVLALVYIGLVRERTLFSTIVSLLFLIPYAFVAELAVAELIVRVFGDYIGLIAMFFLSLALMIAGLVLWLKVTKKLT